MAKKKIIMVPSPANNISSNKATLLDISSLLLCDDLSTICKKYDELRMARNKVVHEQISDYSSEEGATIIRNFEELEKHILEVRKLKNFDKMQFISNVKELAKQKGIKFGDIETESKTSVGYISRLNNEFNPNDPSAEFMATASKLLEVSMDDLMHKDFKKNSVILTENEKNVADFIGRLIADTKENAIEWEKQSKNELENVERLDYRKTNHPLFKKGEVLKDKEGHAFMKIPGTMYDSLFCEEPLIAHIHGNGYCLAPKEMVVKIYLMNISYYDPEGRNLPDLMGDRELYIVDGVNVEPVCSTKYVCDEIKNLLFELYDVLEDKSSRLSISTKTKGLIDSYMEYSDSFGHK